MEIYVYMVRCSDGSYYVGNTRAGLDARIARHNEGTYGGYASTRRPVTLVFQQQFEELVDAFAAERRIKGWSRAKEEAPIRGDYDALRLLAKRKKK